MLLLISSITLAILFIFGAFFSAAETAMTGLSQVDVVALKEAHPILGKRIEYLLKEPDRLIASLLIGNNIANVSASAIVAYITNLYLGGIFIALSTFVLTLVIIVFCEIVPKQIGLIYKRTIVLALVGSVTFFYVLFSPILSLTLWFSKIVFPFLKKEIEKENLEKSLEHMVDLACVNGFIDHYEREFINNVLDLNDKTAKQIMTHRKNIFSIEATGKLRDIYPIIVENSYSRIPVYRENQENIVGILYLNDIQKLYVSVPPEQFDLQENDYAITAAEIMKPVGVRPDNVRVSDLFFYFRQNEGNLIVILDEYGGLAGIVSQEDVLEAVFGKLYDEDETDSALYIQKIDSAFQFSGMLSIQQFKEYFDIEIKMKESARLATISGYICDVFGSIPEQGKRIEIPEGVFFVQESDGQRVITVSFTPMQNTP